MDYPQFAFAVTSDGSELKIFLDGQLKGVVPILAPPPIGRFTYLQPDGVSNYFQPDGVSLYLQPT